MSHTCVEDGRMEERGLRFWMCECPVHAKENHHIVEKVSDCIKIQHPSSLNVLNVLLPPYTKGSSALTHFQHTET